MLCPSQGNINYLIGREYDFLLETLDKNYIFIFIGQTFCSWIHLLCTYLCSFNCLWGDLKLWTKIRNSFFLTSSHFLCLSFSTHFSVILSLNIFLSFSFFSFSFSLHIYCLWYRLMILALKAILVLYLWQIISYIIN